MKPILIKYCRGISGLTQKELADKAGVNHSLISRIESGDKPVTTETEQKIMKVFADVGIDTEIIQHINSIIINHKKPQA